jgi:hypothetical protein
VVQAQRPELGVAAARAHGPYGHVRAELGVGGLAAELIPGVRFAWREGGNGHGPGGAGCPCCGPVAAWA